MSLSALKLGEALAHGLNTKVPSPLHVSADAPSAFPDLTLEADVMVHVAGGARGAGGWGFTNGDLEPRDVPPADAACSMAIAMLDKIQDSVILLLQESWPLDASGRLALPAGRADSESIYLWYGPSEDHAALSLPPIALGEISM